MREFCKTVVALSLVCLFTFAANAQSGRRSSPDVDTFKGNFAGQSASPEDPLSLWYRRPAKEWVEALPIGNGRLGAMIFGGVEGERIQLNEDTLWGGGPYSPINREALAALPEVRRLVFEGKYKEAENLIDKKMMSKPLKQMPYQTVGDLLLAFPTLSEVSDYRRELNINTAVARVTYRVGDVQFTREIFSSAVDNVIVVHLTASKAGQISFTAGMKTPQRAAVSVENGDTLVMNGVNGEAFGIEGKLKFQARVRVLSQKGKTTADKDTVSVSNADSVTLLISAATSFKNYKDVSGDAAAASKASIEKASKKAYNAMLGEHITDYQKFFRRVQIDFGTNEAAKFPTDERIKNFASVNDPQLAALYFQFGRYLLISSSRPGSQPANLQGIWNDFMTPPWESKYTININTEMNYWLAEPANLSELTEPLVKMVMELTDTGAEMAKTHWGARGWMAHHNTDIWRAAGPIDAARYGMWQTGGAWLTTHLWEHYEYTQDKKFLERIYPALKGASEFFLDTLVEEPMHRWLVTNPSMSPENQHPKGSSIVAGPTMDSQIIRDLFTDTIRAAEILNRDKDFRDSLVKTRARLAPNQIGKAGQLMEWLEDWDMEAPEIHHRHVSHLYGVYPSWQINVFDTPKLADAAKRTLEIRGDDATGWAIAWRLNLWARLHDAEHAYKILTLLIRPDRTYPNMFDAHPPFQIDGNFGGTSGMTEMLMQSRTGEIEILPALPKAFANGSIKGLRARGGFEVGIEWKDGKLVNATVRSLFGNPVRLRYGATLFDLSLEKGKTFRWYGQK